MALDDRPWTHRVTRAAGSDEDLVVMGLEVPVAASRFERDQSSYGCHAASVRKLLIHSLVTVALALAMALMLAATLGQLGRFETAGSPTCLHHTQKEDRPTVGVHRDSGQGVEGDYQHV
jgi:hypothetical protein